MDHTVPCLPHHAIRLKCVGVVDFWLIIFVSFSAFPMTAFLEIRWLHIALSFLPFVYFYLFVGEGEIGCSFMFR